MTAAYERLSNSVYQSMADNKAFEGRLKAAKANLETLRPDEVLHQGLIVDVNRSAYLKMESLCPLAVYYAASVMLEGGGWVGPPAVVYRRPGDHSVGIVAGAEMVAAACLLGFEVNRECIEDPVVCQELELLGDRTFSLNSVSQDDLKHVIDWNCDEDTRHVFAVCFKSDSITRWNAAAEVSRLCVRGLDFDPKSAGSKRPPELFDAGLWYAITGNFAVLHELEGSDARSNKASFVEFGMEPGVGHRCFEVRGSLGILSGYERDEWVINQFEHVFDKHGNSGRKVGLAACKGTAPRVGKSPPWFEVSWDTLAHIQGHLNRAAGDVKEWEACRAVALERAVRSPYSLSVRFDELDKDFHVLGVIGDSHRASVLRWVLGGDEAAGGAARFETQAQAEQAKARMSLPNMMVCEEMNALMSRRHKAHVEAAREARVGSGHEGDMDEQSSNLTGAVKVMKGAEEVPFEGFPVWRIKVSQPGQRDTWCGFEGRFLAATNMPVGDPIFLLDTGNDLSDGFDFVTEREAKYFANKAVEWLYDDGKVGEVVVFGCEHSRDVGKREAWSERWTDTSKRLFDGLEARKAQRGAQAGDMEMG